MDDSQLKALLTLHLTPGIGHGFTHKLHRAFGDYNCIFNISATQLAAKLPRLTAAHATKLIRAAKQTKDDNAADKELELIKKHRAHLIAIDDSSYPKLLKLINDPPTLLWVKGDLHEDDALALAIVGSRRCTHYGREQAARFAAGAAQYGLCVVSGGAYGIDAGAHRAAIDSGGRTIAVIGSGLADPYPKDHVDLFHKICDPDSPHGAVISEFPMLTAPNAQNFPRRNRIISGLSLGTLVVEAAVRSGALITARLCAEDHGRELMAVPGRADSKTSAGCHKMIKESWAKLVTDISDVLDCLGEAGQLLKAQPANGNVDAKVEKQPENQAPLDATLTSEQRQIIDALHEAKTLQELTTQTKLSMSKLQAELTMLELRGSVVRQGGKFTRSKKS